jgi:hypothetical protein
MMRMPCNRLSQYFDIVDIKKTEWYPLLQSKYEHITKALFDFINGDEDALMRHILAQRPHFCGKRLEREVQRYTSLIAEAINNSKGFKEPIVLRIIDGKPVIWDGVHRFTVSEIFHFKELKGYILPNVHSKNP